MSLGRKRGKNFRWMLILKIISWVGSFIIGIQTVRRFAHPDAQIWLGQLAFYNAIVFPITLFGASWLDHGFIKFINQNRKEAASYVWSAILIKVISCFALTLIAVMIAFCLDVKASGFKILLPIIASNIIVSCSVASVFDAWGRGAIQLAIKTVTDFLYLAAAFWLLNGLKIQGEQIWLLPFATFVTTSLDFIITWIVLNRSVIPLPFAISLSHVKRLVHFGRPMIFSGIGEKLPGNFDTFLLRLFYGQQGYVYCAFYSVPQRVLRYLREFNKLLFRQFTPEIHSRFNNQRLEALKLFQLSFYVIGLVSLGLWVIIGLNAQLIIEVLYSSEFSSASTCLILLMGAFCLRHLTKTCNILVIAANFNRAYARNQFIVAFSAVIFSLIFIPLLKFNGAALAMVLTYFVSFVLAWIYARRSFDQKYQVSLFRLIAPPFLTCLIFFAFNSQLSSFFNMVFPSIFDFFSEWGKEFFLRYSYLIKSIGQLTFNLIIMFVFYIFVMWFLGPLTQENKFKIKDTLTGVLGLKRIKVQ